MQNSITLIHYYRLHALSNCLCYQKIAASMESKNTREPVKKKFPTDPCRKSNGRPASLLRVHNCKQRSYCREDKLFQREEKLFQREEKLLQRICAQQGIQYTAPCLTSKHWIYSRRNPCSYALLQNPCLSPLRKTTWTKVWDRVLKFEQKATNGASVGRGYSVPFLMAAIYNGGPLCARLAENKFCVN